MIVLYSVAHSNPNGGKGATTLKGLTEREVAMSCMGPMRETICAAGHQFKHFSGQLEYKFRKMRRAANEARDEKRPWVSLALHFNATPMEVCHSCGARRHKGAACQRCGAQSGVRWAFGHNAVMYRHSKASLALTKNILAEFESIAPWSSQRPLIRVPDKRYGRDEWPNNLLWPRGTWQPATLIEAGYGCDERFSDWIALEKNQYALGLALARGILSFYNERSFDADSWHY